MSVDISINNLDTFHTQLFAMVPYIGRSGGRYFKYGDVNYTFNDLLKLYEQAIPNISTLTCNDFETIRGINLALFTLNNTAQELAHSSSFTKRVATLVRHAAGKLLFSRESKLFYFYYTLPSQQRDYPKNTPETVRDITYFVEEPILERDQNKLRSATVESTAKHESLREKRDKNTIRPSLRRNASTSTRRQAAAELNCAITNRPHRIPLDPEESELDYRTVLGLPGRWETNSNDGSADISLEESS